MKIKITQNESDEIIHKIAILCDTPDLQEDYKISQEQAEALERSVPHSGGEWEIPAFGLDAVKGELEDAARVLRDGIAESARSAGEVGQMLSALRLAKRLEAKSEIIGREIEKESRHD